ncbi:hypothetical protein WA026_017725 [Henosepilachna vigintioctopunctata]|uniref:SAM domain-containing protein n=1 Tax=Henosepilachna vigintioctopunctata TaxID=420089 RepID=A0AAW1U9Q7_9CUCU
MMSSATATSPTDSNSELGLGNNIPSNLPIKTNIENILDTSIDKSPKFQSSSHIKPQVLPVVYIQAPAKLPFVTISKPNSTNVIVKSVPPIQLSNLSTSLSNKPISSLPVPSSQSVLLSNAGNSLKSQQIVIQKSGGITNAYLTMIKPVTNLGTYGDSSQTSQIHVPTTASPYFQSSVCQKYVIASLPKSETSSTQTTTTNSVQSKLAFMPLTLPTKTTEPSFNNLKVVNPVLKFKIADGKLQSTENNAPITVMCDSNSVSSCSESSNESKLICTEVIDLDSPVKDEKSSDIDVTISKSSEHKLDLCVKKSRDPKFSQHGVSILKKNFSFGRDSSFHSSRSTPKSDSISDLTLQRDVMVTKPSTGTEETIILSEPKITPTVSHKSGRRKSNFCFRKDFDDIPIQFFDSRDDLEKSLANNDISLTKAGKPDPEFSAKNDEDDIEIKIIKDEVDRTDINMNDNVDILKMIKWDNGVGILPGSELKFTINEFNMIEYLTDTEYNKIIETKTQIKPKEKIKDEFQEEMRCIECGCFGLPSDFISPKYCSYDCQDSGKQKTNKERESKYKKRKKTVVRKREIEETKVERDESESSDDNSSNDNSRDKLSYPWNCGKKGFSWAKYLEHMKAKASPVKLFKDAFPYNRNGFKTGMKLEGIDPSHPSHFCVLTVAEVQGYRMRLHFDGFSTNYDFWVNADSMDIFPMGWCEKYGHLLHPPPSFNPEEFNWLLYLKETKSAAAPKHLFANRAGNAICPNGFRVGMKLEAVDTKNNSSLICVATVRDMMDNRILVHFDSWDDIYDYWAEPTSPYIHPVGWCDQFGHRLTPPNDYPHPEDFTWDSYLRETKSVPAPVRAFKQKPPCGFKKGMKLECVDKRIPQLIRVATVEDVNNHRIKIHFDGWLDKYSYWVEDDSQDIHPAGWCQKTGHSLEPPLTPEDVYDFLECPTIGCKGQGHVLGAEKTTHSSVKDCPYADENLTGDRKVPDRLQSPDRFVEAVVPVSREPKEKPKARVGRPPKYNRIELKKSRDEENDEKKTVRKHKKRKLDLDPDVENRIMGLLQDIRDNSAEKESWVKHSKYLKYYAEFDLDPRHWSHAQVADFIESLPTGSDYADIFKQHEIDGEALLLLTQKDIVDILNIKLGPAIKLYSTIILLRQNIKNKYKSK